MIPDQFIAEVIRRNRPDDPPGAPHNADIVRGMVRLSSGQRHRPAQFRVTVVTDLLSQDLPLEGVLYLAGHSNPQTTQIYDRRRRRVTRNIVEWISM